MKTFHFSLWHYTFVFCALNALVGAQAAEPVPKNYTQSPVGLESITITVAPEKWHLLLVTPNYRVARDSDPPNVTAVKNSEYTLDSRVVPHYNKMYDAAQADGVTLVANSGYRSLELQEGLFNKSVQRYMKEDGLTELQAIQRTSKGYAYPGASEHNLGLCMDFGEDSLAFAETDQFKWLVAKGADYGFILRYPADKTEITGIMYEPWHWRYVDVEVAREIKAKGICLEEYFGKQYLSPEEAKKLKAQGVNIEEYLRSQGSVEGTLAK